MWIDIQVNSERVVQSWWFKSLIWGISSRFPLANHLALPDSESISGLFQGSPMCSHASLSHGGFQWRGLWAGWHHSLFYLQEASLYLYSLEGLLDLRMRNMWSLTVQGSAIPLHLGVSVHRRQTPAAQPGNLKLIFNNNLLSLIEVCLKHFIAKTNKQTLCMNVAFKII